MGESVAVNFRVMGLLVGLAGCGPHIDVLDANNLVGRSLAPDGPTVLSTGSAFDTISGASYSVDFTSADTATLHLFGQVIALTRDASGTLVSSDGLFTLFQTNRLGTAPLTPDIVFLSLIDDFNTAGTAVTFGVDGNRTGPAMPASGGATFRGAVVMVDGSPNGAQGTITLNTDFSSQTVGGSMIGGLPSMPSAQFVIVPTNIFGGDFFTSLTSSDVTVFDSGLDGSFFGASADQIGGTIYLLTSTGNAAGLFSASH